MTLNDSKRRNDRYFRFHRIRHKTVYLCFNCRIEFGLVLNVLNPFQLYYLRLSPTSLPCPSEAEKKLY